MRVENKLYLQVIRSHNTGSKENEFMKYKRMMFHVNKPFNTLNVPNK